MPIYYIKDVNFASGTVSFNNTKTMKVTFNKAFNIVPSVMLTLGDSNNAPAYKWQVTKTDFKIRFKSPYTGEVGWEAKL